VIRDKIEELKVEELKEFGNKEEHPEPSEGSILPLKRPPVILSLISRLSREIGEGPCIFIPSKEKDYLHCWIVP
jgi:hypothetical protein